MVEGSRKNEAAKKEMGVQFKKNLSYSLFICPLFRLRFLYAEGELGMSVGRGQGPSV